MLWIGCASVDDSDAPTEDVPSAETLLWTCFVQAEVPVIKKLFKKINTTEEVDALASDLGSILKSDPGIMIVDEP